jgi:dynein heavy chain
MAAVLIMLDLKPDKKPDPDKPGAKIDDWSVLLTCSCHDLAFLAAMKPSCRRWAPSVRLLTGGSLLQTLLEFDKDHMQPRILERIRKEFVPDPKFTPAQIAKASSAAEGLCKWVLAMVCLQFSNVFEMHLI